MVVVVQFFAADDDAPRRDVGGGVGRFEIAVTPPVAEAVDDAGGGDRESTASAPPRRWHRWRRTAAGRESASHRRPASCSGCTGCARSSRSGVLWPNLSRVSWFLASERYSSLPASSTVLMPCATGLCGSSCVSHLAWCLRWIATHSLVTIPVVSHSQKRKKCDDDRMEVQRAMRLGAVQEDRDGRDRDVRRHQGEGEDLPPACVEQPVGEPGNQTLPHD